MSRSNKTYTIKYNVRTNNIKEFVDLCLKVNIAAYIAIIEYSANNLYVLNKNVDPIRLKKIKIIP